MQHGGYGPLASGRWVRRLWERPMITSSGPIDDGETMDTPHTSILKVKPLILNQFS